MSTCWLNEQASQQMELEADRSYPLETGGILIGYFADIGEPVVTHIIGPGPNAKRSKYRFHPDHIWQCEQIEQLYEISGGESVYLGDWHTHPNGYPNMSFIDRLTLMRIARHPESMMQRPLMMIGAGSPENWIWLCHQHIGRRFLKILPSLNTLSLKLFI